MLKPSESGSVFSLSGGFGGSSLFIELVEIVHGLSDSLRSPPIEDERMDKERKESERPTPQTLSHLFDYLRDHPHSAKYNLIGTPCGYATCTFISSHSRFSKKVLDATSFMLRAVSK